jgi:dihydrofolate synthase/folylpolyglutamate synthase
VITVAGTNGKGTTVAVIEAIARFLNLNIGSYTSPHIWRFNERIKVNQQPVSDADLIKAFSVIEAAKGGISLSYFEFTTLAALWLFQQQDLDLVVLEVGMGGRLDATNIMDPTVAVITSISYDHQEYLGHTLAEIAAEKSGIMREGKPIVCGELTVPHLIEEQAKHYGARFDLIEQVDSYAAMNPAFVPSNMACAHRAMLLAGFPCSVSDLKAIVKPMTIPGRGYKMRYQDKQLLLDVAHNTASIERLTHMLSQEKSQRTILVLGVLAHKDMQEALNVLCDDVDHIILATPQTARGLPASDLSARLNSYADKIKIIEQPAEALTEALAVASSKDLIVVTGSFYMISGIGLNPLL